MLRDAAPNARAGATGKARVLRRQISLSEVLVWRVLRDRPGKLKFRRQHPSGPYILDFYCSDARLAVEVDGAGHNAPERQARDDRRDAFLAQAGIKTLRIPARDVLADLDSVVRGIVAAALTRLPLHHPAAPDGPPPRDKLGEDF
ncbi:endonuclease domain-containing protein [Sphingomonas baiyangensis]|uniref:DUF559 domain-containing protein n=1 Tax=Sphingomonas baiyangensis TaxID=2572576 RepID=A0A4V5PTH2_9SPHN|nr:endonuclease domain-containing protein [Sphingomonas baiyangensis]TKD50048.1 DUF559 domain-containing protein [Sphingomonas baiyangensis]